MDYLIDVILVSFIQDYFFTQGQIDQIAENSAMDVVMTIQDGITGLAWWRAGIMPADSVAVRYEPLAIRPIAITLLFL